LKPDEPTAITIDKENKDEKPSIPTNSIKTEKKIVNINLTFIKQTLKSRLTTCQLVLLLLNILGILIFVIIIVFLRKQPCPIQDTDSESNKKNQFIYL